MAYTSVNFKTKKEVKDAIAHGEKISVFQPGPFGGPMVDGKVYLEGPHYPKPHRWYAEGMLRGGFLVSIK